MLLLGTPAGFERYFDRLAAEYAWLEPPEPSGSAIDCARGEALHAAEVGAAQNAASPATSCATVMPVADATTRTRAGATSRAA